MALKDSLRDKQQLLDEERQFAEEQKQQKETAVLQEQIDKLAGQKGQLESLRSSFTEGYAEAEQALVDYKRKKQELENLITEYNTVLSNAGITTIADLAKAEDYKDEDEVVGFKESGAKLRESAKNTIAIRKSVKQLHPDEQYKKSEVPQKLEADIAKLASEIEELWKQTPEGQQAQREQLKQQITDHFNSSRFHLLGSDAGESSRMLDNVGLDLKPAIEWSHNNDPQLVHDLTKETFVGWVEVRIVAEQDKAGLLDAEQDLAAIAELPNQRSELTSLITETRTHYQSAIEKFAKAILANEKIKQIIADINGSTKSGVETHIQAYAKEEFDRMLSRLDHEFSFRQNTEGGWLDNAEELLDRDRTLYDGMIYRMTSEKDRTIPNLKPVIEAVQEYDKFLAEFERLLAKDVKQVFFWSDASNKGYDNDRIKSTFTVQPQHVYVNDHPSKFKEGTLKFLKQGGGPASRLLMDCQAEKQKIADVWKPVEQKMALFFEKDWQRAEYNKFIDDNHGLLLEARNAEEQVSLAQELQPEVLQARIALGDLLKEEIFVNPEVYKDVEFRLPKIHNEVRANYAQAQTLRNDTDKLNQEIRDLDWHIKKAWVKGSLIKKKTTIEESKIAKETELTKVTTEESVAQKKINAVREALKPFTEHKQLLQIVFERGQTVGQFLDSLDRELEKYSVKQPSEDAAKVLVELKQVEQQKEIAEKNFVNFKQFN